MRTRLPSSACRAPCGWMALRPRVHPAPPVPARGPGPGRRDVHLRGAHRLRRWRGRRGGPADRGQARPAARRSPVTTGPEPGCTCDPAWPSLVVHAEAGDVAVRPAASPGGLACLCDAYCTRCGAAYPGPFRAQPATRGRTGKLLHLPGPRERREPRPPWSPRPSPSRPGDRLPPTHRDPPRPFTQVRAHRPRPARTAPCPQAHVTDSGGGAGTRRARTRV
jgi:hypothetical protein